ncbi:unnamed protein product [Closterium sp. Yama58-4]|nr:unnamed protein product [Closterium sp. Yama58-4]
MLLSSLHSFSPPYRRNLLKRDGRQANPSMVEDMMTGCVHLPACRAARDLIEQVQLEKHTTAMSIAAHVPLVARAAGPQAGGKQRGGDTDTGRAEEGKELGGKRGRQQHGALAIGSGSSSTTPAHVGAGVAREGQQ